MARLSNGQGKFIRSLTGLERGAVAEAFSTFIEDSTATANQIKFIEMIVEHLTAKGFMDPGLLYESPSTDFAPKGPNQVFDLEDARRLVEIIQGFNESAAG